MLSAQIWWFGYGSIPINTIFSGMNIHLPAILMWTTGVQGFDTLPSDDFAVATNSWPRTPPFFRGLALPHPQSLQATANIPVATQAPNAIFAAILHLSIAVVMYMVWIWYGYGYGSSFSYPTTVTNDCQHAKFDQVFGSKFVVSPKEPMDVCNQTRHNWVNTWIEWWNLTPLVYVLGFTVSEHS